MEWCLTCGWQIFQRLGIWVGSPVRTSEHSAVFVNVGLEQPKPHLVCGQEVYFKNSVDCDLTRDVKSLNWNGIIMSPFPVPSLNEALLRVISDRVP